MAGGKRVGNESLAAAGGNEWLRALGILASGPLGQSEAGPCEALLLTKHCAIGAVSPPSLVTSPTLPATLLVIVSYAESPAFKESTVNWGSQILSREALSLREASSGAEGERMQ